MKRLRPPNAPGAGTAGSAAPGAGQDESVPAAGQRQLILYVEDNPDNWAVTELILKRRFDMLWARNDEEACRIFIERGNDIAAILMDIELHGARLNGIELTKLIRGTLPAAQRPPFAAKVPQFPDKPVIFCTAYSARYTERYLIAVGGNRLLTKPVNFAELSMALSSLAAAQKVEADPSVDLDLGTPDSARQLAANDPQFARCLRALIETGVLPIKGGAGASFERLSPQALQAGAFVMSMLKLAGKYNTTTAFLMGLALRRAATASLLAQRSGAVDGALALGAGILMDGGLLARGLHDPSGALEVALSPSRSRLNLEKVALEVEHSARILELTKTWNLSPALVEAISRHHDDEAPTEALAHVAWVTERVAAVLETGDVTRLRTEAHAAGSSIGLKAEDTDAILENVPDVVKRLGEALGVPLPAQVEYEVLLGYGNPTLATLARSYDQIEKTFHGVLQEKGILAARLAEAKTKLEQSYKSDMTAIAAAQSLFLPKVTKVNAGRLEVRSYYRSATECGGDWWWFDTIGDKLRLLVGDTSGHGVGPAVVTATTASIYQTLSRLQTNLTVDDLLALINKRLLDTTEGRYHMTMSILEIPLARGTATLWNAGAPPIIRMAPDGQVGAVIAQGTPLGMSAQDFGAGTTLVECEAGTRLFVFTDGLLEFEPVSTRIRAGLRTLERVLGQTHRMASEQAFETVVRLLNEMMPEDLPQGDDITFALVDVK